MNKLLIRCPFCQKPYRAGPALLGRHTRCTNAPCGKVFRIEEPPAAATAADADTGPLAATGPASRSVGCQPASSSGVGFQPADFKDPWPPGTKLLDTYEVKGLLGHGGMGLVHRVHHPGWNVDLAVKSPRLDLLERKGAKENFEREAETWVNLGLHPHVVSCYYVRRVDDVPRIFAEYVDGGSLADWIRDGRLYEGGPEKALERILDIAIQFAWGLHYAHEQGLVHQDVKPANVMMTKDGVAKVTDFGLARAKSRTKSFDINVKGARIQIPGQTLVAHAGMGTEAYMSPEQANSEPLSRKSDIWSWAVSVLEMFVGDVTWASGTVADAAFEAYRADRPCAASTHLPPMPDGTASMLQKALQRKPEARPTTLAEIAEQLKGEFGQLFRRPFPRTPFEKSDVQADTLNNRALSNYELGNKSKADALWNSAAQIDPNHLASTYNRGLAKWRAGVVSDEELRNELAKLHHCGHEDMEYLETLVNLERDDCDGVVQVCMNEGHLQHLQPTVLPRSLNSLVATARARASTSTRCSRLLQLPLPGYRGRFRVSSSVWNGCLALSSDCRFAYLCVQTHGDNASPILVYELSTGQLRSQIPPIPGSKVNAIASNCSFAASAGGRWITLRRLPSLQPSKSVIAGSRNLEGGTVISHLAFSPDAKLLCSAGEDRQVRVWDVMTGQCLRVIDGHQDRIFCLAVSTKVCVTGGDRSSLKVWNLADARCLWDLPGHDGQPIDHVFLATCSRWAISAGRDRTLRVWDLHSGRCHAVLTSRWHPGKVALSEDCTRALSFANGKLRIWDIQELRCVRTLDFCSTISSGGQSVAFANAQPERYFCLSYIGEPRREDGEILGENDIVWERQLSIDVCDLGSGATFRAPFALSRPLPYSRATFQPLLHRIQALLDSDKLEPAVHSYEEAKHLTGCSRRNDLFECGRRLALQTERGRFLGAWHRAVCALPDIRSISLDRSANVAVTGGHRAMVWDLLRPQVRHTLDSRAWSVAMSSEGDWTATLDGFAPKRVTIWNVLSGASIRTFGVGKESATYQKGCEVTTLQMSSDGRIIACIGNFGRDGFVSLWDSATGEHVRCISEVASAIRSVAFSPDGRFLVYTVPGAIRMWNIYDAHSTISIPVGGQHAVHLAISLDGSIAFTGALDGRLAVWNLSAAACVREWAPTRFKQVQQVAISGDGRLGCSLSLRKPRGSICRLWDLATGGCLQEILTEEPLHCLALSRDGRRIILGRGTEPLARANNSSIEIWNVDWEIMGPKNREWRKRAAPFLDSFLNMHTASWNVRDLEELFHILGCVGLGWVSREVILSELEAVVRNRQP